VETQDFASLHEKNNYLCFQCKPLFPEMKKKYEQPEENSDSNKVNEPLADYGTETQITFSPPLTEEELKEAITGDELREYMHSFIDELFDRNENTIRPNR